MKRLLLIALALTGCAPPEPRHDGRKLSEWLVECEASHGIDGTREATAQAAILAMGTNVYPFLVKWINVEGPTMPEVAIGLARFATVQGGYSPPRVVGCCRAMVAFEVLGTNAAPAIPLLTNMVMRSKKWDLAASSARMALCSIGPPGEAALGALATNPATPFRVETVKVLGSINYGPTNITSGGGYEVRVALTNCLADADPRVRNAAKEAIAGIARHSSN